MACEVCDWRRFPAPAKFMGFVGLVPSEYSTGASTLRYGITKAGNAHVRRTLVEAAWAYQYPARVSRRTGPPPPRTSRRGRRPLPGPPRSDCVDGSVASRRAKTAAPSWPPRLPAKLAGFVWAEMTA